MGLKKVFYIDDEIVISAENLNDIQDAIIALEGQSKTMTPEAYGALGDGSDDSAAIQKAINAAATDGCGTVVFSGKEYAVQDNLPISLPSNITLIFQGGAEISAPAGANFVFDAEDQSNIRIIGGIYERPGENFIASNSGGVFQFRGCSEITIENARFHENKTLHNVRCISCKNVEIKQCVTEVFHGTNFGFWNDCKNIYVHECTIKNGTSESYVSEGKTVLYQYIYGVCSGFIDYSTPYRGIENFVVENCIFEHIDWEAIDSHGGCGIRFENNQVRNCNRWITAYADERPLLVEGTRWGNVVVRNNYCEEDGTVEYPDWSSTPYPRDTHLLFHGDLNKLGNWENIEVSNNTFIDPAIESRWGVISTRYSSGLRIVGNTFVWRTIPTIMYENVFNFYGNYNTLLADNRVIGIPTVPVTRNETVYQPKVIYANCSSVEIRNNALYKHPGNDNTVRFLASYSTSRGHITESGNSFGGNGLVYQNYANKLYLPNEPICNANGRWTGEIAGSEVGLRRISNQFDAVTGAVKSGTTDCIYVSDATDKCIPGQYIEVSIDGGTAQGVVVTDVHGYWDGSSWVNGVVEVTPALDLSGVTFTNGEAACRITYPLHTVVALGGS